MLSFAQQMQIFFILFQRMYSVLNGASVSKSMNRRHLYSTSGHSYTIFLPFSNDHFNYGFSNHIVGHFLPDFLNVKLIVSSIKSFFFQNEIQEFERDFEQSILSCSCHIGLPSFS